MELTLTVTIPDGNEGAKIANLRKRLELDPHVRSVERVGPSEPSDDLETAATESLEEMLERTTQDRNPPDVGDVIATKHDPMAW